MLKSDRSTRAALTVKCLAACLSTALCTDAPARPAATADTIIVTNCLDSGPGSLRDAVAEAGPLDTVDLSQLSCSVITLTSGRIDTSIDLYLKGPGSDRLTIDGNLNDRIIDQNGAGAYLGITGITLTRGHASSVGGCIYSAGPVGLLDTVVTGCEVIGNAGNSLYQGGALYAKGRLIAISSKITNNEVYTSLGTAAGGGIAVFDGYVNLRSSTISGNRVVTAGPEQVAFSGGAQVGGAMYMYDSTIADNSVTGLTANVGRGGGMTIYGALVMRSCTISGNSAGAIGGFILGGVDATQNSFIVQSTISGNHATTIGGGAIFTSTLIANSTIAFNSENYALGAGLYLVYGSFDLESSIIADNGHGSSPNIGVYSIAALVGANNIIGSSGTTPLPPDTIASDPLLLPLADNGGLTLTHALATGSPAIDAGNNTFSFSYDQREVPFHRVIGPAVDIGAIEFDSDLIFSDSFDEVAPGILPH